MSSREEYNNCMRPYMTGSKTKQERQHDMCVGAKICSGKAVNLEEAEKLCSAPRLPKWAKSILPKEERSVSCEDRINRTRSNIDTMSSKVKAGQAEEVKVEAAQVINDIHTCLPEPAIVEMVSDTMDQFNQMVKGYYFKNEGKELLAKLETLKAVLP